MMKKLIAIFLILILFNGANAQEIVSGKSQAKKISLQPSYERGIPPNLFVDMNFVDNNANGILENEESAILELKITNKGKGPAQGLLVTIKDNYYDPEFKIEDQKEIAFIEPGKTKNVLIPINAGFNIKTAEHKLEINVTEHFGYDMDPAYLILNSLEYQKPKLVFSGLEIIDYGKGTGAIIEDGQLQPGELVKVKVVVQNIGQNISLNTQYKIVCANENIYLGNYEGTLGDLAIGEVKEFWIELSPNKRVIEQEKLPIFFSLTEDIGMGNLKDFQLPIFLNKRPPDPIIKEVKADIKSLTKKLPRFEYKSNKFTANISNVFKIWNVPVSKTKRKNSVAVVFGIENYINLPPAPYAKNDAKIVKEYFEKTLGVEQVVIYTNEEVEGFIFDNVFDPDIGELQMAIIDTVSDVFVFYSGHGIPNKKGDTIYLFPSDGKIEKLETQGYDMNKFYKNLEKLNAHSVTVFIDACFSGVSRSTEKINTENLVAMKGGVKLAPKFYQPWATDKNFSVFNSSGVNETSLGFDPSQTGLFTYYLCAGLQGKADANHDNKITFKELKHYVIKNVKIVSKKIRGLQTPEFHGNDDMILVEF